ncbi:MAG TPA: ergothioneine biosynthesis protein EgtB [Mycobacteriales bacterium]|nr:ergothioneine biosynthesis protein EgtB [Mycobacteriales bacterium]
MREQIASDLADARTRTLTLTDFDEPELVRQHDPLMSPLVWDLAHIGQQEELWLLRGGDPDRPGMLPVPVEQLYDAFSHPRAERPNLPLLPPVDARRYCGEVRGRILDRLEKSENLFDFAMVVQHEQQHDETMLATLQLRTGPPLLQPARVLPAGRPVAERVFVPAGEFVCGVDATTEPWSLDNERPAHRVHLPAFWIGAVPVTNAQWRAFVDDGGYDTRKWWSERGWRHRTDEGLVAPKFWGPDGTRIRFGVREELPPDEPVQHICYFEAEAYAAWAGARLPTEFEWEKACAWDPQARSRRRWPWGDAPIDAGRANVGGQALRPAAAGAYAAGASAYGVEQLIGDVWEWTSSGFHPWPGFGPMLYERYSEPFFGGDFRVLRGGSWATGPSATRPSFRNWDLPIRRQIFTGVRLAWDA